MKKDWTGNSKAVFSTLSANSHSEEDREQNDYYATDPIAAVKLLEIESFSQNIWEPCCGEGHLSKILVENGKNVHSTDLIDRGYGIGGFDFLQQKEKVNCDIITNPPYSMAQEIIEHAMSITSPGNKVAMFLKIQFLETPKRKKLFDKYPIKTIHLSSKRISCAKNGDFENQKSSAVFYAWYVWENGYSGPTEMKWFNY